mmetsp:Transcript_56221/g.164277  ORF Transcript_56221/g.164277 Transcript_56221/m.164277 type:complete len:214 (-) Transcript_56221:972-1613(-)
MIATALACASCKVQGAAVLALSDTLAPKLPGHAQRKAVDLMIRHLRAVAQVAGVARDPQPRLCATGGFGEIAPLGPVGCGCGARRGAFVHHSQRLGSKLTSKPVIDGDQAVAAARAARHPLVAAPWLPPLHRRPLVQIAICILHCFLERRRCLSKSEVHVCQQLVDGHKRVRICRAAGIQVSSLQPSIEGCLRDGWLADLLLQLRVPAQSRAL